MLTKDPDALADNNCMCVRVRARVSVCVCEYVGASV